MEHEYSEEFLIELDRRRIPEGYAPMINRLRAQLETARKVAAYARHNSDCKPVDDGPCDCGLNQVLAQSNAGQKCPRCTETNWCGSCDYDKYRAGQKGGK